ncbi:MAG: GWxTD domain-containing protein [Bacteroidales bacterium]
MIILGLMVITFMHFDVAIYRFKDGYSEIWYQIPVSQIFSLEELSSVAKDSIFKKYYYCINVYDVLKQDSSFFEGMKGGFVHIKQKEDYFIDYIPVYLYPGKFSYRLTIGTLGEQSEFEGKIEIDDDTLLLSCSDLILGRENKKGHFLCHGYAFTPVIDGMFINSNTLFSFIEIYNLFPDSSYYKIQYRIVDSSGTVVLESHRQQQKLNYSQVDTFTTKLADLIDGSYIFSIVIFDISSNSTISRSKKFRIISSYDETSNRKFYKEIKYLVSNEEYKRWCCLSEDEKKVYLKKFWAKRDYQQFEKRLLEADEKFSTPFIRGRDTGQGHIYIQLGPPDWIEYREDIRSPAQKNSCQIWHYESRGKRLLLVDSNNDGDFELVGEVSGRDVFEDYLEDHEEIKGYIYK